MKLAFDVQKLKNNKFRGMQMRFILISLIVLAGASANAGKVNDIITAAKSSCGKDIEKSQAIKLIKKMFLTCKNGQKVNIGGCQMTCMKSSGGVVVGDR